MKKKEDMRRENKQTPIRAFLFFLAAFLVYEIGRLAGALAAEYLLGLLPAGPGWDEIWELRSGLTQLAASFAGAGCCLAVFGRTCCFGQWKRGVQKGRKTLRSCMVFLLFAASSALGLNLLLALLRVTQQSSAFEEVAASQASVPVWLGLCIYGICAPFSEEMFFRGLIYGRARTLFPPRTAMVFSGLLFGLFHGNLVQAIYGFVLGTILSFIYEKEGSLREPMLFHGAANVAVYLLIDVWGLGMRLSVFGAWLLCALMFLTAAAAGWICYGKREKNGT